ncbi:MAG: hypothetical protein AB7U75_14920 [Hyphomicrobiaceae bacterium]
MIGKFLHNLVGWKLAHKWTGWHYVAVKMGPDHVIARVEADGDGYPYVRLYRDHIDLQTTKKEWFSLTCSRDVFFPEGRI